MAYATCSPHPRETAGVLDAVLRDPPVPVQPIDARALLPDLAAFSADPASPSSSSPVHIQASASGVAGFRALRLLIDGSVVTQTTAITLTYVWPTTGLAPVAGSPSA